jgi:hypothetical protein
MLERLPPELLADVLEIGDRNSLYICCLVSKAMCATAQPLLWREMRIVREEQVASIVAAKGDAKRTGKTLRLKVESVDPYEVAVDPIPLLRVLPNLQEVELHSVSLEIEDLLVLCTLPSLSLPNLPSPAH